MIAYIFDKKGQSGVISKWYFYTICLYSMKYKVLHMTSEIDIIDKIVFKHKVRLLKARILKHSSTRESTQNYTNVTNNELIANKLTVFKNRIGGDFDQ